MTTRTDRNQVFDRDGNLVSEEVVEVDITAEVNKLTIEAAIVNALAELQAIVDGPTVAAVPAGTLTAAQLSNGLRALHDEVQLNRAGVQRVAARLKQTIRLVLGDFDGVD